jgi:sugar-specific transcriptional regulator TrmB
MFENVVAKLVRLGLKEYEARVYAALVGLGEGTARQIHEASGVPRPRVYDILEGLAKKGFVEVRHGTPTSYRAVEPNRVISKLREDFVKTAQEAVMELEKLSLDAVRKTSPIWYVKGDWSIKSRIEDLIERVERELIVLCIRAELVEDVAWKIREITSEKRVVCVLMDDCRKLANQVGDAEVVELAEIEDLLSEIFQTVRENVFKGSIEVDGVEYKVKGLFIADGKESILVYEVNQERMAVTIKLPIIPYIQRMFFERIISGSRKVF